MKFDKKEQEVITVRLETDQLEEIAERITELTEWSTNRIVDYIPSPIVEQNTTKKSDTISSTIKWIMGISLILSAVVVTIAIFTFGKDFWNQGSTCRITLFVLFFLCVYCFGIGIETIREKDRNYIISLFSTLVALVALIVTLVK